MKKLRLDLESLAVESFDTVVEAEADRGTVRGRDSVTEPQEPDSIAATCTCPPPNTASCGGTCDWTCGGGCTVAASCGQTCDHTCWNSCYSVCGPEEPR